MSQILPVAHGGFKQQGSVDWVKLVENTATFSVGVLARLSAAGVDPYTVLVGQAVAQSFYLGPVGRKNVQQALAKLTSYNGFGNALWFGFGLKSFVRALGSTEEGCSCLSICAALSECYPEDLAAEVLHELTLAYKAPHNLTPSANEWLLLVRACAGTFAASPFPLRAEKLMSLKPSVRRSRYHIAHLGFPRERLCASPTDLAAALIGLGKVTRKELASITIIGGAAAGWLAALSEWLFDLTVIIFDEERNLLYTNCAEPLQANVQIIFDSGSNQHTTALQWVSKTYYLKDASALIHPGSDASYTTFTQLSGRLCWETCLISAFGKDFKRLLKISIAVGTAIGCAARIFKGIVQAEPGLDPTFYLHCVSYFDSASGQGFINSLTHYFPELSVARSHMEEATSMTMLDALSQYEMKLAMIESTCACEYCSDSENEDIGDGQKKEIKYCLVTLLETILVLCRALSGMDVAENLFPTRSGLEWYYEAQLHVRLREAPDNRFRGEMGPIVRVCENPDISLSNWDKDMRNGHRIFDAARLFAGRDVHASRAPVRIGVSALSVAGVCVYLDTLRGLSLDPQSIGRVHVIPGFIERDGKPFNRVEDDDELKHMNATLEGLDAEFINVSMVVKETVRSLSVGYQLTMEGGKAAYLGPAHFLSIVSEARGLIHCGGRGCRQLVHNMNEKEKYQEFNISGKRIAVRRGDDLTRCAFMVQGFRDSSFGYILRDGQCMQCCLRAALGMQTTQPIAVISG